MKKLLLSILATSLFLSSFAQCTITPNVGTYIMSPLTVGSNYTLNGTSTYPAGKAFYICQGTIVTLQNRAGADTFYVATGAKLIGFEASSFRVFLKSGATYDATVSAVATVYWETGATISNYTGPGLPPCPGLTINMTLIGPNTCTTTTGLANNSKWNGTIFVFPNPAENEIAINTYVGSNELTISIYDVLGNIILEQQNVSNQMNLDITSLAKGIYFLRVMNGNEMVGTEKFVKN